MSPPCINTGGLKHVLINWYQLTHNYVTIQLWSIDVAWLIWAFRALPDILPSWWQANISQRIGGHSFFPYQTFYVYWTLLDKMSDKVWVLCWTSAEVCQTCPAYFAITGHCSRIPMIQAFFTPRDGHLLAAVRRLFNNNETAICRQLWDDCLLNRSDYDTGIWYPFAIGCQAVVVYPVRQLSRSSPGGSLAYSKPFIPLHSVALHKWQ